MKIVVSGTTINCYVNGILKLTATDNAISSGKPGIYSGDPTVQIDDWVGGDYGAGSGWTAEVDGSDIADATISHLALFDKLVAGQIAAGAVGADEIAANQVAVKHLVVTNFGQINSDPNLKDGTAWEWNAGSGSLQTVTDGAAGDKTARSATGTYGYINDIQYYPINSSKTYRLSFWARAAASTNGTLYSCLRQYSDYSGTPCATNGGRSPYKPVSGQARPYGLEILFRTICTRGLAIRGALYPYRLPAELRWDCRILGSTARSVPGGGVTPT